MRPKAKAREDNIWQNESTKRWHWEIALKREDGSTYRKAGSSKESEKAKAIANRDAAIKEFKADEGRSGKWTLEAWSRHVMENIWPNELAATSRMSYTSALERHVFPNLGDVRLSVNTLTVPRLQEWANRLAATGRPQAARNSRVALASVLSRAVENGLLTSNPARNVKLRSTPKVIEGEDEDSDESGKVILTAEERTALTKVAFGTEVEWIVLLGLNFGLRLGESCGLQWSDIDLEERVLRVRRQSQYVTTKGIGLVPPKSKYGRRSIPIPQKLVRTLERGRADAGSIFVSPNAKGELMDPKKVSAKFKTVARAAGFTVESGRVPTSHDLRSTFASIMANDANNGLGMNPYTLMKILGHGSLEMATKHYVRTRNDDLKKAMEAMEAIA